VGEEGKYLDRTPNYFNTLSKQAHPSGIMPHMAKRLIGDREIIIPIGIAIFSIVGMLSVALIFFIKKPQAEIPTEATLTPFKFLFLGTLTSTDKPTGAAQPHKDKTSTAFTTPTTEANQSSDRAVTATPQLRSVVGTSSPIPASSITSTPGGTGTPTINATTSSAIKIDDFDDFILYDGGWISETVDAAYEETLSISIFIGDTATFTFTGTQFIIGYVADPQLGAMTIAIDGNNQTLNQSTGSEWSSPKLSSGEHSVTLTHATGEIIYLDYITILGSP